MPELPEPLEFGVPVLLFFRTHSFSCLSDEMFTHENGERLSQ